MFKLLFPLGFVALVMVLLSALSNLLPNVDEVSVVIEEQVEVAESSSLDWQKLLKEVPAYFKKVEKKAAKELPQKKQKVRKRKPTEAKFVAVVNLESGNDAFGVFLLPKEPVPKSLKVGDGWLEPWTIKELRADYVIWINNENSDEIKQVLF